MKNNKIKLGIVCLVLSVFTLLAFHIPFFRHVFANVEPGFNAFLIVSGLAVLMLAANYFLYYLLMYPGRVIGRALVAFTLVGDAISLYFINTYETVQCYLYTILTCCAIHKLNEVILL